VRSCVALAVCRSFILVVKVIINSPQRAKKEPANLPEREPVELVRERLGAAARQAAPQAANATPTNRQFDGAEASEFEQFLDEPEMLETHDEEAHSWRHSRWVPVLFVAAVIGLGALWYFASHFDRGLALERVKVEGNNLISANALLKLAAIDGKQSFYSIDLKKIERRVAQHSLVKFVHVRRELSPATIVVSVEERQPVAMLKSDSTGETFIIDRDGNLLRPKQIMGLTDQARLLAVPLLSGVNERDTTGFRAMSQLVARIESVENNALAKAVGELRRAPTGSYVIYTPETQTPMFIGSPFDMPFQTALEAERANARPLKSGEYFMSQIALLAKAWRAHLEKNLRAGNALYVDARFHGQIVLKHRTQMSSAAQPLASADTQVSINTRPNQYATNAIQRSH
jgi:cell division septal protein FtsQ